ncbi:hypothetical protein OFB61_24335, partial [Escherichia coli]|nr:hypothetical protein [Escherichia coli]
PNGQQKYSPKRAKPYPLTLQRYISTILRLKKFFQPIFSSSLLSLSQQYHYIYITIKTEFL